MHVDNIGEDVRDSVELYLHSSAIRVGIFRSLTQEPSRAYPLQGVNLLYLRGSLYHTPGSYFGRFGILLSPLSFHLFVCLEPPPPTCPAILYFYLFKLFRRSGNPALNLFGASILLSCYFVVTFFTRSRFPEGPLFF